MKKRRDKRVQLKRLRFQIKQTFNSQKDPFHLLDSLEKLKADIRVEKPYTYPYHLIPVDVEINYLDYQQINKTDPLTIYKLRYCFDPED